MRYLYFLILIPQFVFAGFLSWFYTSPEIVTEFDCPYQCGKSGTEGIKQVQWKGVQVLWELDHLGHAIKGESLPYHELPLSKEDTWFKEASTNGVVISFALETPEFLTKPSFIYSRFNPSKKGSIERQESIWWPVIERDNEGEEIGYRIDSCTKDFDFDDDNILDEYHWALTSLKEIHQFSRAIDHTLTSDLGKCFQDEFPKFHDEAVTVINDQVRLQGKLSNKIKEVESFLAKGERYLNGDIGMPKFDREEQKGNLHKSLERSKKHVRIAEEVKEKLEKTRNGIKTGLEIYGPRIRGRLDDLHQSYCAIFDHCIAHHNAPEAYYQRALFHFAEGNNTNSIEDIKKLFEMTPSDMITDKMRENLLFRQGKAECELDLFDDAIFTLSKYISAFPRRKEAYLERAIAHFEVGNTQEALRDFINSEYEMYPIIRYPGESLEYTTGLMKGLARGSVNAFQENCFAVASSISGLSHGIISVAIAPEETSQAFVTACQEVVSTIKENGLAGTIVSLFPEAQPLFVNEPLHPLKQGELTGQLIGRFGVDILLLKGGAKAVEVVRDFRKANAVLTLERMSKSIQVEQQMIHHSREWWNRTSKIIDELKAVTNKDLGKGLYRTFRDTPLSEIQVRKILHHTGFKTFSRPKGIPSNYIVSITEKHGGMVYKHPTNPHFNIRVSPGIPESSFPAQRNPYVVHKTDRGYFDVNGKIYREVCEETHIPVSQYDYNKLSNKVVSP